MAYTQEQIQELLKTNVPFAIGFMADNNFRGLQTNVNKQFDTLLTSRVALRDFLVNKLKSPNWQKAVNALNMTDYIGNISDDLSVYDADPMSKPLNYTIGYKGFFDSLLPAGNALTTKSFSWNSIFSGLGAGFSAYANANQPKPSSTTGTGSTTPTTPSQADLDKAAADKKAADEAAAKKKRNTIIIISVISGLAVIIVIIIIIKSQQSGTKKITA